MKTEPQIRYCQQCSGPVERFGMEIYVSKRWDKRSKEWVTKVDVRVHSALTDHRGLKLVHIDCAETYANDKQNLDY